MTYCPDTFARQRIVASAAFAALLLALSPLAWPGNVNLSSVPLTTATTTKVLPNLMYIQDNSGSMNWDYIPDRIVDGNYCKGTGTGTSYRCCRNDSGNAISTSSEEDVCNPRSAASTYRGMPPFVTGSFNRIYYNPALTYLPPLNADGTTKTVSFGTNFSAVPYDGYDVQDDIQIGGNYPVKTVNLPSGYPDVEWCTNTNYTDCLRNDNYLLPGVVDGKNYNVQHAVTVSTGTNLFATGTVANPTTTTRTSRGPFYYAVVPGEYCTTAGLTTCVVQNAPTTTHSFPAYVRWCDSAALTNCRATGDTTTYRYPRYPTVITANAVNGSSSVGEIRVGNVLQASNSNCANATTTNKVVVTDITLNGQSILATKPFTYCSNSSDQDNRNRGLVDAIIANMGNGFTGWRDSTWNRTVEVTTPVGTTYNNASLNYSLTSIGLTTTTNFAGGTASTGVVAVPGKFVRIDIASGQTYGDLVENGVKIIDRSRRSDCTNGVCTYAQELQNFANWVAWYRSRMQMMKTSVSRAFQTVDTRYRVGYLTINNRTNAINNLQVSKFNTSQKASWFNKLFAAIPDGGTPLRSSLALAGQIYAGQTRINSGDEDPIEYSCQQNFVLLTTDGYWNSDDTAASNNSDVRGLDPFGSGNRSQIGNQDASPTPLPYFEGPTATYNTLADVAKYLYDTDLRDAAWAGYNGTTTADNCTVTGTDDDTGVSFTRNVCENNVFVTSADNNTKQHITTFTLGLGVDGNLQFQDDYQTTTDTNSDFYKLRTGTGSPTVNWPVPQSGSQTTVDDLWHAAVNGQGRYFSPKDPAELGNGLAKALASITAKTGAGAAAATSTLSPVSGDNFAYVASYTTAKWTGNLERRGIDTVTGEVSETAVWCAESILTGACSGTRSSATVNSALVNYCSTPLPNCPAGSTRNGDNCEQAGPTCPSDFTLVGMTCTKPACPDGGTVLSGTTCRAEVPAACSGTLPTKVAAASDTRTIKVKGASGVLVDFDAAFATANPGYFDATKLANLSQWPALSTTQRSQAVGATLVNYLRGRTGNEDEASNPVADRLFRAREAVFGDLIEAKPSFMGKPKFSYADPGYADYAAAKADRLPLDATDNGSTVYAGANDGMLHAFNASSGQERWAFIPTPILPNLYKLADTAYGSNHVSFVNGSPFVADICVDNTGAGRTCVTNATEADWKTILIGGLNGGGRGYYALDVTDPSAPSLLWEFTNANDADLGYTYGNPIVTKRADGTWVVIFTSGYNNASGVSGNTTQGDGKGYLYVLNANTGAKISKIATNVGSEGTPSGLGKIAAWVANLDKNNTSPYVYAGDLLGNLWRFDINNGGTSGNPGQVLKFAVLKDSAGTVQPITVQPELGQIVDKRVVFVGTGKYLESSDLTTTQRQSIYAIKDDNATATLDNPRNGTGANDMVEQTLSVNPNNSAVRVVSTPATVDWTQKRGWYVDLPAANTNEGSERVNVTIELALGILAVPTTVPASSDCNPGGYGYINYFDYLTGGSIPGTPNNGVSYLVSNVIVGVNTFYVGGKPVFRLVTSNGPTPTKFGEDPPAPTTGGQFQGRRAIWRELVQ